MREGLLERRSGDFATFLLMPSSAGLRGCTIDDCGKVRRGVNGVFTILWFACFREQELLFDGIRVGWSIWKIG